MSTFGELATVAVDVSIGSASRREGAPGNAAAPSVAVFAAPLVDLVIEEEEEEEECDAWLCCSLEESASEEVAAPFIDLGDQSNTKVAVADELPSAESSEALLVSSKASSLLPPLLLLPLLPLPLPSWTS
jgi:hypothetical protein